MWCIIKVKDMYREGIFIIIIIIIRWINRGTFNICLEPKCFCICWSIPALVLLPVISYFLGTFSHSLIPSTSHPRINYIFIDWPLGRGIDIHRPPSAPSLDVYSTTQESGPMHYTRITLFIVFLGGVDPQMPLWRKHVLKKFTGNEVSHIQRGHVYAQVAHKLCHNEELVD